MRIESAGNGPIVVEVNSEDETQFLGQALASVVRPGVVIGLVGELGAGKTRLVRAISEFLGADPLAVSSPTYVLIHEYDGRMPIYHFDAYRLQSRDDFLALGVEEYFDGEGVCLIEWADRVADDLPRRSWWIRISRDGDARRFELTLDPVAAEAIRGDPLLDV